MQKKSIPFTKMAGAGNDFIVIEAKNNFKYREFTVKACDRSNGLGGDGVLVLDRSKKADYRMRIFNADGSEAEMCGNGVRCLAAYVQKKKKPRKKIFAIETLAGIILAEAKGETAHVRLRDPAGYRSKIPLTIHERTIHVDYIDTGVPHVVVFVEGLSQINVDQIAPGIRFHETFAPRGTNVNFVEVASDGQVAARTFERGVEGETRACGTGSVASAIIAYLKLHPDVTEQKNAGMKVVTAGKEILDVHFDLKDRVVSNVWLRGSARFVAEGKYFL